MIDVQRHQAELNPDGNRPATVAEVFMEAADSQASPIPINDLVDSRSCDLV